MRGVLGVMRHESLPTDMTRCRGVEGALAKTSRWRGVDGVMGALNAVQRQIGLVEPVEEQLRTCIHLRYSIASSLWMLFTLRAEGVRVTAGLKTATSSLSDSSSKSDSGTS